MTSNSEEVKKLEPIFTTNPDELKGEIINVSLKKGVKFGFHLIGMTGTLVQDKFTQVDEVDSESPADINGILPGDIIVYINQKCILGATVDDVDGIFASFSVGDVVDIQLCRGYAMQKIPYVLNFNPSLFDLARRTYLNIQFTLKG